MELLANAITKNESFEAVLEDARDGSNSQEDSSDGSIFMFIGISVAVHQDNCSNCWSCI